MAIETQEIRGNVDSVERKTSPTGKEYGEIFINGQRLSSWKQDTISMAEMCLSNSVRAVLSRKEGSQWWNIDTIEPQEGEAIPVKQSTPAPRRNGYTGQSNTPPPTPFPNFGMTKEMQRSQLLNLAVQALSQASDKSLVASAQAVVDYAQILEAYLTVEG